MFETRIIKPTLFHMQYSWVGSSLYQWAPLRGYRVHLVDVIRHPASCH